MSSDDESAPKGMRFSADGDFDELTEVNGEFYGTQKAGRRLTREQQLYGIFADEDEEWNRKPVERTYSVAAPLNFVKGATLGGTLANAKTPVEPAAKKPRPSIHERVQQAMVEDEIIERKFRDRQRAQAGLDVESDGEGDEDEGGMQSSLLGIDAYDSSDADSEPQQHTEGQPINKADDSEEDVDRPRFGMGMFANHNESVQSAPAVATAPTNPDGEIDIDDDESSAAAKEAEQRLKARQERREGRARRSRSRSRSPSPAAAAVPAKSALPVKPKVIPKAKLDKDFAAWTKHESGGGAAYKMMLAMGLDPKNPRLGKSAQGIVNPIIPKLRPKGVSIGYGGFSEQQAGTEFRNAEEEAAAMEKQSKAKADKAAALQAKLGAEEAAVAGSWRKKKKAAPKKYMSAQEFAEMEAEKQAKESKSTGPATYEIHDYSSGQARVISASELKSQDAASASEAAPAAQTTLLPEFQFNVKTLVELTEADIQALDRKRRQLVAARAAMQADRDLLRARLEPERQAIERVEAMCRLIDAVMQPDDVLGRPSATAGKQKLSIDELAALFERMRSEYAQEYAAFRVASLAIALVFPLIRRSLDAWQPLSDPASPLALLAQWRPLLESSPGSAEHDSSVDEDVYRRLLDELIVPKLRTTLISEWQPSLFPLQGISLIDAWRPPCLPVSLHRTLLSSVILPRLQRAAESWDPRSPVCPPAHTWLHCWLPLLGEAMEPIHSTVRHKVTNALSDWQPSDITAFKVIEPWVSVWGQSVTDSALSRCVLPKLQAVMRAFVVNPAAQDLAPLSWVLLWEPLLPLHHLIAMFESEFFPKWFHALYVWLSNQPDFEEIFQWYNGWKSVFPASLATNARMETQWSRGLDLLNAAMEGEPLAPIMQETLRRLRVADQSRKLVQPQAPVPSQQHAPAPNTGSSSVASSLSAHIRQAVKQQQQHQQQQHVFESEVRAATEDASLDDADEVSFKELIERFAAMKNVRFVPNDRRERQNGKQVYLFGRVNVYMENRCIFAEHIVPGSASQWRPIALDDLLKKAQEEPAKPKASQMDDLMKFARAKAAQKAAQNQ